ncbi:MAG TPA: hypothetical protein VL971_01335 [Rhizomicrobium sp.]|nr:hypothetical protein [Rhizomicrobium sp.]
MEFFIPPACRENVAGDLHERYSNPHDYIIEALLTVPLVVLSRIRRTTDPGVLLMEALLLYLTLFAAAWEFDRAFLYSELGLLLISIPTAVTLIVLVLEDAYANPKRLSPLKPILQAAFAVAFAFGVQMGLTAMDRALAIPRLTLVAGLSAGLVLVATVRLLFPPWVEPPKAG